MMVIRALAVVVGVTLSACGGVSVEGAPVEEVPPPPLSPRCAEGEAFAPRLCFPQSETLYVWAATAALRLGDTDGDGRDEVFAAQPESSRVLRVREVEGLLEVASLPAVGGPVALDVGDLDGDTLADVAIASASVSGEHSVAFARASDALRVMAAASLASEPFDLALFSSGSASRVAVVRDGARDLSLFDASPSGATPSGSVPIEGQPTGVVALPGTAFVAVASRTPEGGVVTLVAGDGAAPREVARVTLPGDPNGIAAGPLALGSTAIVVTLDAEDGAVVVLTWDGHTLQVSPPRTVGPYPHAVALGDIDADGRLDAVVVAGGAAHLEIFRGDGSGRLRTGALLEHGVAAATSVALGDVDGDGFLDVAVAGIDGELAVLRSAPVVSGER